MRGIEIAASPLSLSLVHIKTLYNDAMYGAVTLVMQDKAYDATKPRIFPGKGGIDTVLENMLKDSIARLDDAKLSESAGQVKGTPDTAAIPGHRKELKVIIRLFILLPTIGRYCCGHTFPRLT